MLDLNTFHDSALVPKTESPQGGFSETRRAPSDSREEKDGRLPGPGAGPVAEAPTDAALRGAANLVSFVCFWCLFLFSICICIYTYLFCFVFPCFSVSKARGRDHVSARPKKRVSARARAFGSGCPVVLCLSLCSVCEGARRIFGSGGQIGKTKILSVAIVALF